MRETPEGAAEIKARNRESSRRYRLKKKKKEAKLARKNAKLGGTISTLPKRSVQ